MENTLINNLLKKGELPSMEVTLSTESIINLMVAILITTILAFVAYKVIVK